MALHLQCVMTKISHSSLLILLEYNIIPSLSPVTVSMEYYFYSLLLYVAGR
jgi:hypothetical protein